MGPIRIDANSTTSALKEVFSLEPGKVFGVSPEFFENFVKAIPKDRFFKFTPIVKDSADYSRYGSNCYKVLYNNELIVM